MFLERHPLCVSGDFAQMNTEALTMGTGPASSLCHMQSPTGPGARKGSRLIYSSAVTISKLERGLAFSLCFGDHGVCGWSWGSRPVQWEPRLEEALRHPATAMEGSPPLIPPSGLASRGRVRALCGRAPSAPRPSCRAQGTEDVNHSQACAPVLEAGLEEAGGWLASGAARAMQRGF